MQRRSFNKCAVKVVYELIAIEPFGEARCSHRIGETKQVSPLNELEFCPGRN